MAKRYDYIEGEPDPVTTWVLIGIVAALVALIIYLV